MPSALTLFADLDVLGLPVHLKQDVSAAGKVLSAGFTTDKTFTVGDILNEIYSLAVPGGQLVIESPWDALTSIDIDVSKLSFQFDVTGKRIGFAVSFDQPFPGIPGIFTLESLEVFLSRDSVNQRNRVDLSVLGSFLTLDFTNSPGLTWDLLRDPAPTAPGQGSAILDLRYLGLGQHVSLNPTPTTMPAIVTALEAQTPPSPNAVPPFGLTFDGTAGWLAGLDLTVLGTVSLSAVFNDPALYGLLVSLQGDRAKALAGLSFEILYRKIDSTVGVYHIELKLPDGFRHIDLGEAALTLPIIDIDIYTDGSFLIDFGFPWNLDFSRSLTIDVIVLGVPVQGAAGFYFGVLDAHTATTSVHGISNGVFSPVIVFGVGVQIGIAKDFDEGPLTAGFLIAIEGVLEGVLAFFHPNDPSTPTATFFKVTGMVSVIGHLYGSVDFSIIKARVDVTVQITVQVVFQIYEQVLVTLDASVSISLSVEVDLGIFSVSMDLEFHASIHEQVVFGSHQQAPWIET